MNYLPHICYWLATALDDWTTARAVRRGHTEMGALAFLYGRRYERRWARWVIGAGVYAVGFWLGEAALWVLAAVFAVAAGWNIARTGRAR